MPPNLGGFFMVRSYYPSECHADYFDFERIEALKPAIEACGISTLSQSPMLGFHKQMDNRIKLLEEILSFRMQGVEFDNGDMYVDGHKAASDVRDEFVSVTEKLMDELAQCYNVLPQLDINNTIDHRPEGDEKWLLENEKAVTQFCRKLAAERPLKDIRDEYNYPKKKGIKDECSRLLEASTMKSRRGFAIQRLMNAMRQAHADGWFIVFDTLTMADDRLEAFYDNPNALRDYFRDIGRMVLAAEGRKANDSHADCYQYFCVPEYGTAHGRLHFHAVHFMRTLPTGSVDPNFGRRVRNRRQLNSLQNTWPYGYSFFFSSRRRHTRCLSDWSSDVCSSDLAGCTRRRDPARVITHARIMFARARVDCSGQSSACQPPLFSSAGRARCSAYRASEGDQILTVTR